MLDSYMNVSSETSTFLMGLLIATLIVGLVVYLILGCSWARIFKANGEKGFKAFIPIYNACVLMEIVGMNPIMVLLFLVPIVNLFVLALLSVRVANKFEKGAGFAVGLLFLPFILYPVLALSLTETKEEKPKKVKTKKKEALVDDEDKIVVCSTCGTTLAPDATECFVCGEKVGQEEVPTLEDSLPMVEPVPSVSGESQPEVDVEPVPSVEEDIPKEEVPTPFVPTYTNEEPTFVPAPEEPLYEPEEEIHTSDFKPDFSFEELTKKYTEEPLPFEEIKQDDKIEVQEEKPYTPNETNRYKSSSKTLDEILKLNNDLYANMESKKQPVKPVEVPKESISFEEPVVPIKTTKKLDAKEEARLEKEVDDFVKELMRLQEKQSEKKKNPLEEALEVETHYTPFEEKQPVYHSVPLTVPTVGGYDDTESAPSKDALLEKVNEINLHIPSMEIEKTEPKVEQEELHVHFPKIEELPIEDTDNKIEVPKEETEETVKPGIGQVRVCPKCGSTIPRYSQRCLLCGESVGQ